MNIQRHELFSVPVSRYEDFLPLELAQNIGKYILTYKVQDSWQHGAIQGDALSLHNDVNNYSRFFFSSKGIHL